MHALHLTLLGAALCQLGGVVPTALQVYYDIWSMVACVRRLIRIVFVGVRGVGWNLLKSIRMQCTLCRRASSPKYGGACGFVFCGCFIFFSTDNLNMI